MGDLYVDFHKTPYFSSKRVPIEYRHIATHMGSAWFSYEFSYWIFKCPVDMATLTEFGEVVS